MITLKEHMTLMESPASDRYEADVAMNIDAM